MLMRDFGRLDLRFLIILGTAHTADRTIIQNPSAEGITVSKGGPGIIEMTGLLALNQVLAHLVTPQDMVVTITVTTYQEALPLEGPNQTEVEESLCPMKVLLHTQILVIRPRIMTRPISKIGMMKAGVTTTLIVQLGIG